MFKVGQWTTKLILISMFRTTYYNYVIHPGTIKFIHPGTSEFQHNGNGEGYSSTGLSDISDS